MCLGFALGSVGLDKMTGTLRMTFGHERAAGRLRLPDRRHRPVRHRRDPVLHGERPQVLGQPRHDPSRRRAADLEEAARVLGHVDPQLHRRLLDGHHARRRDAGLVHELRPRQALLQARRQLRQGRDRGRGRAGDRRARRRHQRAAADADARHSRLADGGGAARRPA